MRICGLSREMKKLPSCWTAIFWNASFFGRSLFAGIEPPPGATKQRQHNDEQNNDLPG
jgi:hypothetical protein